MDQGQENAENADMEIQNQENTETSKKVYTSDKWKSDLKDVKILKEDMNGLVMNYLVAEGNVEAIEKFHKESGTMPKVEFASIKTVYEAVKSGNVEDAIEQLNGLNPEILKMNPEILFHLQLQSFIELIRDGKTGDALKFCQEKLAPYGVENEAFLKELKEAIVLFGFKDFSECPSKALLDKSQRFKRAKEVSAAYLRSQSGEKDSKLQRLLKMLTWNQNQLNEKAVVYPRMTDLSTGQLEVPANEFSLDTGN